MKKMIFSAVALVAFSFAGMANETDTKVKSNKIEVVNTMIPWDCVVEYVSVYNELVDTFGHQEAHDNAIAYAQACVKNRFGVE